MSITMIQTVFEFKLSIMKISFLKHFIHKMSVSEKSFFKNHQFHDICFTTLIHYYKMENNYVIFIIYNYCKDFEIFFASLQRIKMQRKSPV